jgi:hypothetical protein
VALHHPGAIVTFESSEGGRIGSAGSCEPAALARLAIGAIGRGGPGCAGGAKPCPAGGAKPCPAGGAKPCPAGGGKPCPAGGAKPCAVGGMDGCARLGGPNGVVPPTLGGAYGATGCAGGGLFCGTYGGGAAPNGAACGDMGEGG